MGYTHYWGFTPTKISAKEIERQYQEAIKDCHKIILYYSKKFGGLSGYSAHTDIGSYGGIFVNGSGTDSCEDFVLREHYKQNTRFNFCKTNHCPYDTVITACLIRLSRLPGVIISTDGKKQDWIDGMLLYERVLRRKAIYPVKEDVEREAINSYL